MILTFFFISLSRSFKTNSAYIFIKTNPFSMYDVIYALSLKCSPTKNFLGEQIPFFLLFFNAFALFENFLFFKNLPFFSPFLKMSERNKYIYSSIQLIEALMPMPRR